MQAGQEILVDRADGTRATFVATRVERHDKEVGRGGSEAGAPGQGRR